MNALKRLWQSMGNLAAALDRMAGMVHCAADQVEQHVEAPALENRTAAVIENNGGDGSRRGRKAEKQA